MLVSSDSLPRQLGCIAPHHIDILSYNPQWNVLPPNIPHIVPCHHRECRLGSFLIPCWSFWGLIPDLCFDWTTSRVLKHYIHTIWSCCVKRGLKEVHDCWRIVYGVHFQCQRREEGVRLVDEVDMASGHHWKLSRGWNWFTYVFSLFLEVSHGAVALTHFSLTHIAATLLTHSTAIVYSHTHSAATLV